MNQRELKFRAWDGTGFIYSEQVGLSNFFKLVSGQEISQYTGLSDKNGKEIYEGDIVRIIDLQIEYQTHYGDNIIGGEYTEPCGIKSNLLFEPVVFHDGEFTIKSLIPNEDEDEYRGQNWLRFPPFYDREILDGIFYPRPYGRTEKLSDEEFLETAGFCGDDLKLSFTSIEDFIKKINGIEVIANIYEHPKLLKNLSGGIG